MIPIDEDGGRSPPYRCRTIRGYLRFVVDSPREPFPAWHINPQISQILADPERGISRTGLQFSSICVHRRSSADCLFSEGSQGRLTNLGWGLREAQERCAQHTLPLSPNPIRLLFLCAPLRPLWLEGETTSRARLRGPALLLSFSGYPAVLPPDDHGEGIRGLGRLCDDRLLSLWSRERWIPACPPDRVEGRCGWNDAPENLCFFASLREKILCFRRRPRSPVCPSSSPI